MDDFEDEDDLACAEWLNAQAKNTPSTSKLSEDVKEKSPPKTEHDKLRKGIEDLANKFKTNQGKPKPIGLSTNAITVNPSQKGNSLLEHIHGVPWRYADSKAMVPDYIMSPSSCCLFLSLRYHALRPDYIYDRIKALRQSGTFSLQILLCLVDIKEPTHVVKELTKAALIADMTLLLAFSNEEAGTYIETFKSYEKKSADLIQTKVQKQFTARAIETVASIRSINSTDADTLLSNFDSITGLSKATEKDLSLCPGIGGLKAKRIADIFKEPFLKPSKS